MQVFLNVRSAALFLLLLVLVTEATDDRSETRTLPSSTLEAISEKLGNGYKIIDISKYDHLSGSKPTSRLKRAANDQDGVDPKNIVTMAKLNDSHPTLVIHWAGESSDLLVALAKSPSGSSSSLFLSWNYGRTYTDVSKLLNTSDGRQAVLNTFYSLKGFINHYIFTDVVHKCVFTTDDAGHNFNSYCNLPFRPKKLSQNSINPSMVLGMDDDDPAKQLYYSEDFCQTWRPVFSSVKSFYWGVLPYDDSSTIYIEKIQATGKAQIIRSKNLFTSSQQNDLMLSEVISFEMRDEYMFATKSVRLLGAKYNPQLQLWVSYNRGHFMKAEFPVQGNITDFFVADTSEGQMMVCATVNETTNLYISDSEGYRFSLSLERVVYFNPKTINNLNWLRLFPKDAFVDLTKVNGIPGIYIASQQSTNVFDIDAQITLISFDKGGQWQRIQAPNYTIGHRFNNCSLSNNCSLHLTQEYSKMNRDVSAQSILTQDSAPGLVIASGIIGQSIKGNPDVYLSRNAGITWHQILTGNYLYMAADHGGILVAVRQAMAVDEILYSMDEGETWSSYRISSDMIKIYGLLTEPGENTTVFSLFGSLATGHGHSWVVLQVNFTSLFNGRKCNESDYKMWSIDNDLPGDDGCLLGHITQYQRRLERRVCYNGEDFVRKSEVRNCACTREDFECDFGFEENTLELEYRATESETVCRQHSNFSSINAIPSHCPPGTFYSFSRGYRKVAGDTCEGGQDHRYGPIQYACPIQERSEFLLITELNAVSMVDLSSGEAVLMFTDSSMVSTVPAIFDYQMNCVMYVVEGYAIQKKCLSSDLPVLMTEVKGHQDHSEVAHMAFDWTGRNIYFTDPMSNTIRVVNVDGRYQKIIYGEAQGVYRPRAIVVDPHHGYLLYVGANDKSNSTYSIFRAVMDGSDKNMTVVANSSYVASSILLTLDIATERLLWVNPNNSMLYSSSIFGAPFTSVAVAHLSGISGVGIYKNSVYVVSQHNPLIFVQDNVRPTLYHSFARAHSSVMGMVVVSNTSQHAMSACSTYNKRCTQLCMPRPTPGTNNQNRTCLCGDGYLVEKKNGSTDESCLCEKGEIMQGNGTCTPASPGGSCAIDKLTCRNGHCILMMWKCDGDDDCGDGTDESDCPYTTCNKDSFTCHSGKCIPSQWRCDKEDDCRDGLASDELNCGDKNCSANQFKCSNGYCIDSSWKCDLDNDCHDNSDEEGCFSSCKKEEFMCNNGKCINNSKLCDGHLDCSDGLDELGCAMHTNCSEHEFYCGDGNCTYVGFRCDGDADCANSADEINCTTELPPSTPPGTDKCGILTLKCDNGGCISWLDYCNGIDDCGDGSDEAGCDEEHTTETTPPPSPFYTCSTEQYMCEGATQMYTGRRLCVWKSWVCDGTPDCPQGDDERNCQNVTRCAPSEFQCVTDGGCIPFSKRCNNKVDCMDSSDELQCGTVASDCSIFNDHKEGCCNTPSCGVYYTATSPPYGRCTSVINASTYRQSNRCDGVIAAPYECLPGQVKCNNTKMTCISWVQVCDNQKDCVGNSMDEDNCYDCQSLSRQSVYLTPTNTSMHFVSLGANLISYAEKVPDLPKANLTWKNFSRISGSDDTILGLKPATPYIFVFFQTTSKRLCPVDTSEMSTLDGLPSEPKSVTTALRLENYPVTYIVDVQWKKPDAANGKIISYVVYYQQVDSKGVSAGEVLSKTITGQYQQLKNVDYQTSVVEQIEKGKTYDFWVTAVTSAGEGTPSKKVTIATDSIPQFDLKVTVANVSATGFIVKWVTDPNAVGYKVTVISLKQSSPIFPAGEIKDVEKELSKTETSLLVDDLCPQSDFKVLVQALYANKVKGLAWKAFSTTTGTQPLVSIAKVEKTGPTSAMVSFNVTQGSAKKFHIYYTHDNHGSPLNLTSLESSYEIKGLYACENYFVWVRPVSPFCPSSGVSSFITEEDDKAPPKDLEYELIHESYQFNVTLKWTASCYKQSREIGYIITVQNGDNPSTEIAVQQTSLTKIRHTLPVKDNQIYTFSVRTLVPGSQNSPGLKVKIPSLAGPVNFVAEHVGGLQVVLRWTWDFISDPDFREFLVFSSQGETTMKNHTSKQEILLFLPNDGTYFFKVHAMSKEGETIAMSQELQFSFENVDAPTNDKVISLSQTNFVAILVPVAVVVVGLSAGLVFFIVRHRRLQRSFLAFANSHYNIQSGTTTFSDDLDGDEPMIQGFSDDEPLVIA